MKVTEKEFPALFEKYKTTVYSVAFHYVRNCEDAADIEQDVFLKLLSGGTEYESEEHMKAWLIRVSINLCKNHLRKRSHLSDDELPDNFPAKEAAEQKDLFDTVLQLPEKYRIPIHLFYYEDYSVKQIASVMSLPEATVKVRLKRGRDRLGKLLRKEEWM